MNSRHNQSRFGAKLLFQYCVYSGASPLYSRRKCEVRIINFLCANSARSVKRFLKAYAAQEEYSYHNHAQQEVRFEFVGVLDVQSLGDEMGPLEVWYEVIERVRPRERKDRLVPDMDVMLSRLFGGKLPCSE